MKKSSIAKITKVEIRTTSLIGSFYKVFFEDLTVTPSSIKFNHQWLDPAQKPITWSSKSNSNDRFLYYYLFIESLIKETHTKKLRKKREFTSFKISLYEGRKLVYQNRFNGSFLMNKFKYSRNMLLKLIPECEFKPMYLLDDTEYKLEAEEFGEEIISEEKIINEEEIKKEIMGSLDS